MLFVLLILVLFVSCSLSQPVGISYLYRDSSCLTPYQIEITYGNLCVYSRTNYTSKLITPVLYANIFPINNTVEVYEYASGNYPTVACTGSFKSFIQQFPTTCTLEADILTGNSYYRNIQLLASNPGVANLTHNRPYALVK